MTSSVMSPEDLADWVRRSCAEQEVPVFVTDPAVVRDVGTLLRGDVSLAAPAVPEPTVGMMFRHATERTGSRTAGTDRPALCEVIAVKPRSVSYRLAHAPSKRRHVTREKFERIVLEVVS